MFDPEYNAYRVNFVRSQYNYLWNKYLKQLRISDMELAELMLPKGSSLHVITNLYRKINNWANGKSQLSSNDIHTIIKLATEKDITLEFAKLYENPNYTHHRYQYEKQNRMSIEQDVRQLTQH